MRGWFKFPPQRTKPLFARSSHGRRPAPAQLPSEVEGSNSFSRLATKPDPGRRGTTVVAPAAADEASAGREPRGAAQRRRDPCSIRAKEMLSIPRAAGDRRRGRGGH